MKSPFVALSAVESPPRFSSRLHVAASALNPSAIAAALSVDDDVERLLCCPRSTPAIGPALEKVLADQFTLGSRLGRPRGSREALAGRTRARGHGAYPGSAANARSTARRSRLYGDAATQYRDTNRADYGSSTRLTSGESWLRQTHVAGARRRRRLAHRAGPARRSCTKAHARSRRCISDTRHVRHIARAQARPLACEDGALQATFPTGGPPHTVPASRLDEKRLALLAASRHRFRQEVAVASHDFACRGAEPRLRSLRD